MTKVELRLEVGEDSTESICACCGRESWTGHGFIYRNGDARAIYYVGASPAHEQRRVTFAVAVGEWVEGTSVRDRVCFGVEAVESAVSIDFRFMDGGSSPWRKTELLGEMLTLGEAQGHLNRHEVLAIVEKVVREHPAVSAFLHVV